MSHYVFIYLTAMDRRQLKAECGRPGNMEVITFAKHTCQSCAEIEYYSVAYFDRVTVFKAPYLRASVKGGAQMRCVNAATINAITHCV